LGTYLQIATHFADLHDTPGRMLAKGVISSTVPWKRARSFFYWRLRRRLAEFALRKHVMTQVHNKTKEECGSLIKTWFVECQARATTTTSSQPAWKQYAFSGNRPQTASSDGKTSSTEDLQSYETAWKDDKAVLAWLNESSAVIDTKINELKTASITNQICELGKTLPSAAIDGLIEMMSSMDEVTRQSMIQTFHDKLQKLKF